MPPCPPPPAPVCIWMNYEKTVRGCSIINIIGADQGDIALNQNVAPSMLGDVSTIHMLYQGMCLQAHGVYVKDHSD